MTTVAQGGNEWIEGFLIVANRPILDFLNTKPVLAGVPTELLPDFRALERWLVASGMVTSPRNKAIVRTWRDSTQATAFLQHLISFRERFREAVLRIEDGLPPSAAFLSEINSLLQLYPRHTSLHQRDGKVIRKTVFELREPADLWAPFADATADLLSEPETSRIRQCESCVLHFFDISKKGSRRWCSMNICGNKLKVAAYQKRRRRRNNPAAQ